MSSHANKDPQHLDDYEVGAEIGRGSFATVYKGTHRPTQASIAIKAVSRSKLNKKLLENLESEISILRTMSHPHIVGLLDYQRSSSHFYLVMEYCSLGDLSYFIRHREKISTSLPLVASLFERYPSPPERGLHEDLARHFIKQLASALHFLRDRNLVHRDIKPQNLLLCPPKKSPDEALAAGYAGQWELPVLKLADFGFARILPNASLAETLCGSPLYMAPEILRFEKYNAKADLWSVGAVLYEMVVGKPPFRAANHVELLKRIEKAEDRISFPDPNVGTESIRRLIRALLKKSPTERIGFAEFFTDPVIQEDLPGSSRPLDQSKLDERIFISEYIEGVPTTSKLPSPPPTDARDIEPKAPPLSPVRQPSPDENDNVSVINSPSPGSSLLVVGKKRSPSPRTMSAGTSTMAELRRSGDKSVEQDYVLVEKRTVEVNALADELAYSPTTTTSSRKSSSSTGERPSNVVIQTQAKDRRLSIVYGTSPTKALTKALNMASARLFGTRIDSNGSTTAVSPPRFAQRALPMSIETDERALIKDLESLATKAKVINLFAEVKYSQLLFGTPEGDSLSGVRGSSSDNIALEPEALATVAEEALVLYVKTLSLLARAMDRASDWWTVNDQHGASMQLNDIVQWIREKFNESLEKAEYSQAITSSSSFSNSRRSSEMRVGGNRLYEDKRTRKGSITAEKLIFDRALEMSRAAAVNEQLGEDLDGCELSYGTAVWMLEALLEYDNQDEPLDDEDQSIVQKFITSISHRLAILRTRLDSSERDHPYPQTPAFSSRRSSRSSTRSEQITEISSHPYSISG